MAAEPGSIVRRHAHAAATALREALRTYREAVALGGAAPGFADALAWAPHCLPDTCRVFDDNADERVRAAVRRLVADGLVRGDSALVGKMVALAPPAALAD